MFHEIWSCFFTWLTWVVHARNGLGKDGCKRFLFLETTLLRQVWWLKLSCWEQFSNRKHQRLIGADLGLFLLLVFLITRTCELKQMFDMLRSHLHQTEAYGEAVRKKLKPICHMGLQSDEKSLSLPKSIDSIRTKSRSRSRKKSRSRHRRKSRSRTGWNSNSKLEGRLQKFASAWEAFVWQVHQSNCFLAYQIISSCGRL